MNASYKYDSKKVMSNPRVLKNQAVIYCRVSTKDQVVNFSLSTQENACREYCDKHGFRVTKVFVEEGESAKTANRTKFKEMLEYCRENKSRVGWVVVYSVSRFARSVRDHSITRAHLETMQISLRSVTEPFDETPQGKCMEGMLSVFSQFDNDVRAERTVVGMKAAIQAGKWTFKAPLGYRNAGRNVSPSLIADPERGPLVRQAFELFSTGLHTKQKVLEMINTAGLRTINGTKVSGQTFEQILRKPVYAGWVVVSDWSERQRGDFEPIVSEEVFERVQALLNGRCVSVMPRMRSNPDFPLRHFVKCGCCGRPLTASWSTGRKKKYGNYRCQNKQCERVNITKAEMESAFVVFLEKLRPKPQFLNLLGEIVLDVWKEKQAQNLAHASSLKNHIEDLEQRRERLVDTFVYKKAIDQNTYQRELDKLNEQIVLAEMAENDAKLEGYDVESVLNFAAHVILNASRLWLESSSEQKERLQKVLFPKGVVFTKKGYGTTEICPFFNLIPKNEVEKNGLATLPGIENG